MSGRALAGPVVDLLSTHPAKAFPDGAAWRAHLASLGIDRLAVAPDPAGVATEEALWGAVRAHGLLPGTVIVSDDAGQFRVGEHALCWMHAERLVHNLVPATDEQRRAIELKRTLARPIASSPAGRTRPPPRASAPPSLPRVPRTAARSRSATPGSCGFLFGPARGQAAASSRLRPQPHPRPAAVLLDELHPCGREGRADGGERAPLRRALGQLEPRDGSLWDVARCGKLVLRPRE
jgi:hypothetical protein